MKKVICNSIGSTHACVGCGASVAHDHDSCEPCPINKEARCTAVVRNQTDVIMDFILDYTIMLKQSPELQEQLRVRIRNAQRIAFREGVDARDKSIIEFDEHEIIQQFNAEYLNRIPIPEIDENII